MGYTMIKKLIAKIVQRVIRRFPGGLKKIILNTIEYENPYLSDQNSIEKIENYIKQSIIEVNSGAFDASEQSLLQAAKLDPSNPRIAPYLSRVRFLRARSGNSVAHKQNQEMFAAINIMRREIETKLIYVPSEFWKTYGNFHVQLLERYGIENFKRTVSHHYQNWTMVSHEDPQVQQLFKMWPAHFATEPWFNIMENPDHVGMHNSLSFDDPTYPLVSLKNREIYRIAVGLLWEYVKDSDSFNVLSQLTESEIGNPIKIWRKGNLISSDLAHSVRERNMLLESQSLKGNEGKVVGELGAGHGRLAEVFGKTTNFRYFIFDITPALFVSQWYIKTLFPNEKIFEFRHFDNFSEIREELQQSRFAFFTANQIEQLPNDSVHLFINMNSLMEMRVDQINNFLRHIDRITIDAFLSRQYIRWYNNLENNYISKEAYSMNSRWRLILDKVDDIYPSFFNQIWSR